MKPFTSQNTLQKGSDAQGALNEYIIGAKKMRDEKKAESKDALKEFLVNFSTIKKDVTGAIDKLSGCVDDAIEAGVLPPRSDD